MRDQLNLKQIVLGTLLGAVVSRLAAAENLPAAVVPQRTTTLFNGRDLSQWYTWLADSQYGDPRGVFSIQDGHIRISGDGFGYLATRSRYRDYRLVCEFRWGERNYRGRVGKARDAGVFLHGTGPDGNSADGNGAFMAAIECQIMEACTGDLMLIRGRDARGREIGLRLAAKVNRRRDEDGWPYFDPGGTLFTLKDWGRLNRLGRRSDWQDTFGLADTSGVEKPAGRWNRLECRCDGQRMQVWLNGRFVNEASELQPHEGRVLLQCEGSEIFFRRLELLPLTLTTEP